MSLCLLDFNIPKILLQSLPDMNKNVNYGLGLLIVLADTSIYCPLGM